MPQTASDPFNMIPSNANDEMDKLRESIPPKDRCPGCDGVGMVEDLYLRSFRVCRQCGGSGRNNQSKP